MLKSNQSMNTYVSHYQYFKFHFMEHSRRKINLDFILLASHYHLLTGD